MINDKLCTLVETERKCNLRELPCGNRCIPPSEICNGIRDCPDGSDEASYHCQS